MNAKAPIRVALAGANGRMGRCVLDLASRDRRFHIVAALTESTDLMLGSMVHVGGGAFPLTDRLEGSADVFIDFTTAAGTMAWLAECERRGLPLIIGATGHDESQSQRLLEASKRIPILKASNFSLGIHAVLEVLRTLARKLGDAYDIEIVETHHRHKRDAPSGTAKSLLEAVANGRIPEVIHGREGESGERPRGQIAVHSVRMGEIVGEHEVHFSGPGETISVRHEAHSREAFAVGALQATIWIVGRSPALYSIGDVIQSER